LQNVQFAIVYYDFITKCTVCCKLVVKGAVCYKLITKGAVYRNLLANTVNLL
jgi:hypothetical protein